MAGSPDLASIVEKQVTNGLGFQDGRRASKGMVNGVDLALHLGGKDWRVGTLPIMAYRRDLTGIVFSVPTVVDLMDMHSLKAKKWGTAEQTTSVVDAWNILKDYQVYDSDSLLSRACELVEVVANEDPQIQDLTFRIAIGEPLRHFMFIQ